MLTQTENRAWGVERQLVPSGAPTDPPLHSESQWRFKWQTLLGGPEDTARPGCESLLPLTGCSCLCRAVMCQAQR